MSVVMAAVGGSALLGAVSADRAADKAADATKSGIKQSGALSQKSREDAMALYTQGRKSAQQGLTGAFDFYKKAAPGRYQPITLGNVAAQRAIGQGAVQANNAILGNPVDMSFAQPQQINPDMSFIQNAQLPVMEQGLPITAEMAAQPTVAQGGGGSSGGLLGKVIGKSGVGKVLGKIF